ncbi:MAG: adenylate/guanylate cyclase domain-containing protein [Opitutaceae bacterium]|nr:adenylate/guanylate cyclase domain-containing protein [Opitutaceae bacterium]
MPLFRFRRFSRRLLLLLVGLMALVQLAVFMAISTANHRNAIVSIGENLRTGSRLFQNALNDRIEFLEGSAGLMSGDSAIKSLLIRNPDPQTLRSILLSYTERVKARTIGLFSPEGDLLGSTNDLLGAAQAQPFRALIEKATTSETETASGYAYLADRLHVLVVVPLYAPRPDIAAWFGLAYPIDAAFAQSIRDLTRLDVTFSSNPGEGSPRVLSSTLDKDASLALARVSDSDASARSNGTVVTLAGEPYVTLFESLPLLNGMPARLALQRSLNAELQPARALQRVVMLISAGALVAASLASLLLARNVSEPLQRLAAHTRHVAKGDYSTKIQLDRADEFGALAAAFNHMTTGLAERDRVRSLLGKVVSPEIATQLLKSDLTLGGEEREVTILFCDLRDFTGLSEKLSPTDLLGLLNRYLDRMSAIIERNGGVIDKYIGDAIMALFGAPVASDQAARLALETACEMARELDRLNRDLAADGSPMLSFGIGINTARVIAGNMGSKSRMNYTVIGDGVNLAARLESLTRDPSYGTPILFSEATLQAIPQPPPVRELGMVSVKGKTQPVKIYTLADPAAACLPPRE